LLFDYAIAIPRKAKKKFWTKYFFDQSTFLILQCFVNEINSIFYWCIFFSSVILCSAFSYGIENKISSVFEKNIPVDM
jgi:hypothetical protein